MRLTPIDILKMVCDHYDVNVESAKSAKQDRELVRARDITTYLCRKYLPTTYKTLAGIFHGRNDRKEYSGLINSRKKVIEQMKIYPEFRRDIEMFCIKIENITSSSETQTSLEIIKQQIGNIPDIIDRRYHNDLSEIKNRIDMLYNKSYMSIFKEDKEAFKSPFSDHFSYSGITYSKNN